MQTRSDHPAPFAASLARLQRLARPRAKQEYCELCHTAIPVEHQHLLELKTRQLHCACEACAILFSGDQAARYRRVPRRVRRLDGFQLTDLAWESLHIPINLAFFYRDGASRKVVAMYPSPAGATESLLPMDAWADLAAANPILETLEDDVEALLVNRVGERRESFWVPIDRCYQLVGVIRTHWRGLSGGSEVWREIARFFQELDRRAVPTGGHPHA
jgi:hypothetical protein